MKHTTSIIKLFSLALFVLVGTACIDNFDKINQKDYQVDKEELGREGYNVGASLKGLQGLVIPTEEHLYQFVEALAAGAFSGYIGCTVVPVAADAGDPARRRGTASPDGRAFPRVSGRAPACEHGQRFPVSGERGQGL